MKDEQVLSWVAERLRSGDLGLSSRVLLAHALDGGPLVNRYGHEAMPGDPADLGRCERLYELAPTSMKRKMLPVLKRWRADVAERYSEFLEGVT